MSKFVFILIAMLPILFAEKIEYTPSQVDDPIWNSL